MLLQHGPCKSTSLVGTVWHAERWRGRARTREPSGDQSHLSRFCSKLCWWPMNTLVQRLAGAKGRMSHMRSVLSCARRPPRRSASSSTMRLFICRLALAGACGFCPGLRGRAQRSLELCPTPGRWTCPESTECGCAVVAHYVQAVHVRAQTLGAARLDGRCRWQQRGPRHGVRQQVRAIRGHAQPGHRVGVARQRHRDLRLPQVPHLCRDRPQHRARTQQAAGKHDEHARHTHTSSAATTCAAMQQMPDAQRVGARRQSQAACAGFVHTLMTFSTPATYTWSPACANATATTCGRPPPSKQKTPAERCRPPHAGPESAHALLACWRAR